ncbi:MAG: protein translocase subunit SecD [Bacillota bacterium]|jgi:preprotein translocase subunit SecD|nr:protein translocase subunit SecD [Bacillota bacterium]HOB90480.1 protein translocase subunit SecD [Bacillota bacterium]HQD17288.1 protein translocase subunit SecD [Bacillota bacterium]
MSRRNALGLVLVIGVTLIATAVAVYQGMKNVDRFGTPINLGLELQGGISVVLEVLPPPDGAELTEEMLDDVAEAVRRRVDEFGVAESTVQRLRGGDSRRIVVELPGITDLESAREVIGSQGVLVFKIGDEIVMSGSDKLRTAVAGFGGDYGRQPALKLSFSKEGGRIIREASRTNIGNVLTVYLDDAEILSGIIKSELGEDVEVTGSGVTLEWAKTQAAILRGGVLPAPIQEREARSVSPVLGERIVYLSFLAGVVGIALVLIFMAVVYKVPGLIADFALVVYMLIVYSAFVSIGATLSLSGIAGFVLSVGMAVDANIVIFERIKEERLSGKRLRSAIDAGFRRALAAVLDANITTLIVAAILYYFGTGRVQGFALTLGIGILASLFTAITVTKVLLSVVVDINPERSAHYFGGREMKQSV